MLNFNDQELFDLKSFALEFKIEIHQNDGTELTAGFKLSLIDGAGHRTLSKCSLLLNGTPSESNSYFGLYSTVKSYLKMNKDDLKTLGRNTFCKDISTKNP